MVKRGFGSDNNAGVHPEVLRSVAAANEGHVPGYGDDPHTLRAVEKVREHLGAGVEVYFVFNGTAANVLALDAVTRPYHAVVCAETSHIDVDECGAPERYVGCKLLTVPTGDGKLTVEAVGRRMGGFGVQHHSQPKVVSIAQSTEMGTVYTPREVEDLANYAHRNGMLLHMDGARLANAAAGLGCDLADITADAGVDVLSFGGTKNGLMGGEAVVFFDGGLAEEFRYVRKQGMQLASKMRFISAQFDALLSGGLWRRNAENANAMAALLSERVAGLPGISLTQRTQSNAVFATLPESAISRLREEYFFEVWDEAASEARWVTSWDTTAEDVEGFVADLEAILSEIGSRTIRA